MQDFTIAIYCFIDDLLQTIDKKRLDSRRKLSDAQVITTAIIAARYFQGNQANACAYMKDFFGFEIPDKSNFNKNLHLLSDLICKLFYQLSSIFKALNLETVYIIDSFPVPVCKNIRIRRANLLREEKFRGYNASKKEYFYGFKVHVICTGNGMPVEVFFTAGSVHDNTAMQAMDIDLPENSDLYGDSAYLNKDIKALLEEMGAIKLKAATKKNSIEKNTKEQALEINYFRKRIETTFASINALFPKKIHAVTPEGFLLKVLFTIIAVILHTQFK
jgi:hypothetical protein